MKLLFIFYVNDWLVERWLYVLKGGYTPRGIIA